MFNTMLVPMPPTLALDHSASQIAIRKTRLARRRPSESCGPYRIMDVVVDSVTVHCISTNNGSHNFQLILECDKTGYTTPISIASNRGFSSS